MTIKIIILRRHIHCKTTVSKVSSTTKEDQIIGSISKGTPNLYSILLITTLYKRKNTKTLGIKMIKLIMTLITTRNLKHPTNKQKWDLEIISSLDRDSAFKKIWTVHNNLTMWLLMKGDWKLRKTLTDKILIEIRIGQRYKYLNHRTISLKRIACLIRDSIRASLIKVRPRSKTPILRRAQLSEAAYKVSKIVGT